MGMLRAIMIATAGVASLARAQAPATAPSMPSLHARIVAQYDGAADADPAAEMRAVRALEAELGTVRDPPAEDRARVDMLLALAHFHQRDYADAVREADAGVATLVQAGQGNGPLAVEIAMNGALFLGEQGDRDGSAARLEQVKAQQTKLFGLDSSEVGATLGMMAYNALSQGRLDYAITTFRAGLARFRPDPAGVAAWVGYHNSLTAALASGGRVDEQLDAARVALDLAQKNLPPRHRGIAIAMGNLAIALDDAGRFAEGEAISRQAIALDILYRGKNNPDTASAMRDLAASLAGQGRALEAEAELLAGKDVYLAVDDKSTPRAAAGMLLNAAESARSRGDDATADARTVDALALLTKSRTPVSALVRARADASRALGLLLAGHADAALPFAQSAETGLGDLAPTNSVRTNVVTLHGLILARLGRAAAGLALAAPVEEALESALLESSASPSELVDLAPAYASSFTRYAAIALAARDDAAAFRAIQLANLSSLAITNSAVAARLATADPGAAALARAVQDLRGRRHSLDRERSFALGKSASEVARLDAAIAAVEAEARATAAALDARFPAYRSLSRPAPLSLADVEASLGRSKLLLMPLMVDDGIISVAMTGGGMVWARDSITPPAVLAAVSDLRAALEAPGAGFPGRTAYRLYRALFPRAVADLAADHPDIVLFGGGALSRLPLGVLVTAEPTRPMLRDTDFRSAPWLIRTHSIEVATSLAGSAADVGAPHRAISFAGIGAPALGPAAPFGSTQRAALRGGAIDPGMVRALPSLPGAAAELRRMGETLRPERSLLLLGDEATEARVNAADLASYSVVAFATHGVIEGAAAGLEPALILTPMTAAAADDGLLTASEASALRLNADWLILSGCDTAGAGDQSAPVFSGLARAFFQAGARSVLVSMWPIRDDVAARLTVNTLLDSRTLSKSRALQRASVDLMRDRTIRGSANPALWAPFTLLER